MLMVHLLLMLAAGGALAWWSESLNANAPRWVSLAVLAIASIYLFSAIAAVPAEQFSLIPSPDNPQTWLLYYQAQWIPRFGISFELAMDGLSLILVMLTLLLGMIAVVSSWSEIDRRHGFSRLTCCGP